MSTYPIVKIAGINLNDPSGRWDAAPGTLVMPHFPGRVETRVPTPGVPGARTVAYAPGEPMKIPIVVRFNAVETYANEIVPGNGPARMAAIHQNIDTFFYATALARQGYSGLVEISKEVRKGEVRVTAARMVAASEPEYRLGDDYATMNMVFESPSGVWLDKEYTVFQTIAERSFQTQQLKIPCGTAPQTQTVVAFRGPYAMNSSSGSRVKFTNELNIGFEVGFSGAGVSMGSRDWMLVNCQTWKNDYQRNLSGDYPKLNWGMGKSYSQIHPVGRSLGNALTLLPSQERGVAILRYQVPAATRIQIRTRRAWY